MNDLRTAYYELMEKARSLNLQAQRSGMVAADRIRVQRDTMFEAAETVKELMKENDADRGTSVRAD